MDSAEVISFRSAENEPNEDGFKIAVAEFADARIPEFKEDRRSEYVRYGEDNLYPAELTHLYNKSPKHNALVNGKTMYIFGKGFSNGDISVSRLGETLNDISKKSILDIENYGGFYWEIMWNAMGKIAEIYHVEFETLRRASKQKGYFFNENWDRNTKVSDCEFIPDFNPRLKTESQIFSYREYRPGTKFYPLPGYVGSINYILTDIEISKYYLSAISNGMMPSKAIQFFKGEPSEDKKKLIQRRFSQNFTGAGNAGKFIMIFNNGQEKAVQIDDLSATELDKQFIELNKTTQQEIFSGHQITTPLLFGIKTEGQLGGNTELAMGYTLFKNTYATPKAEAYSKEVTEVMAYSNFPGTYELQPTDPVGIQFDVKDVINALPKKFVFETIGVPKEDWALPNIGSDNKPTDPTVPVGKANQSEQDAPGVNDNIKNLTGKQHQAVARIIRQYSKGQLTELAAKTLLRTGYGLSEQDINDLLGIETKPVAASADEKDLDAVIEMFDSCGDLKADYKILKSKFVNFSSTEQAEEDEGVFIDEAFTTYDVTLTEDRILELIKKDKRITPEVIASAIGQSKAFVEGKIADLMKRGYLEESVEMIGTDQIIERTIPKAADIIAPPPKSGAVSPTKISIKYSYEVKPGIGPEVIKTTRPFCRRLLALNRLYTRADIEAMSARLGYSVWDRKGGWWGDNPECRHRWQSHIVLKK